MGISRLKLAVMVPFVAFVAVLATSVSVVEYQKFRRESSRISLEINSAIDQSFQGALRAEAASLRAVAEAVAANDGFRAAFRQRDRQRLNRLVAPLFAGLHRGADITHLYFIDSGRQVFLRGHQPDRFGDVIDRFTAVAAARSRAAASGIELGPLGTLTLRVVVPWVEDGQVVGFVETGKEIDHLFDALRRQFDLHPLVFIPKSRLDHDGWMAGMTMLGRSADWDEFPNHVLSIRDGIAPEVLRHFLSTGDGEIRVGDNWYAWLRLDVPDAAGQHVALVGLVRDVTARHAELAHFILILSAVVISGSVVVIVLFWLVISRVEAELLRSRRRTEALLSSAGEGIVGVDAEGRCVFANPVAQAMLGFASVRDMTGRDMHLLTGHAHGDGTPCGGRDCALRLTLADGRQRRVDQDLYSRQGGGTFPVEFAVTAVHEDEAITGAVLVFHDITSRRHAEAALAAAVGRAEAQAREVARINGELEQFAFTASHDLRQPLRMVTSYLGLIERHLGGTLDPDLRTYLDFATSGARRMDRLILDLLEYSRTGSGVPPSEPVALDVAVAESLVNLDVAVREADAHVTVADGLPMVMGGRADLVRLFQNLIGNAIKYRVPGRRPEIEIGHRRSGDEVEVWVRDNGTGMDPADHERAFRVFQRLVRQDQVEGSGIGLAICKKIVTNCGGRIWVDSAEGEGCCFRVAFPVPPEVGQ